MGQGNIFIGVCQEFCSQGGCLVPGGCLLPGGVSAPGGVPAPRGCLVPGGCLVETPPGGTATAADGTHPTGMHSCSCS